MSNEHLTKKGEVVLIRTAYRILARAIGQRLSSTAYPPISVLSVMRFVTEWDSGQNKTDEDVRRLREEVWNDVAPLQEYQPDWDEDKDEWKDWARGRAAYLLLAMAQDYLSCLTGCTEASYSSICRRALELAPFHGHCEIKEASLQALDLIKALKKTGPQMEGTK